MAVVFISPKKRQRAFFVILTLGFLLFIGFISLGIFFAKPKAVSPSVVFNKSKINIDMSIFDSQRFRNLHDSPVMGFQYNYRALNRSKIVETGFISAESVDEAKKTLEGMGLTVTFLEEVKLGRDNPFVPYYTVVAAPVVPPVTPAAASSTTP